MTIGFPALSLRDLDGKVLVHCHAGQRTEVEALKGSRGIWPERGPQRLVSSPSTTTTTNPGKLLLPGGADGAKGFFQRLAPGPFEDRSQR